MDRKFDYCNYQIAILCFHYVCGRIKQKWNLRHTPSLHPPSGGPCKVLNITFLKHFSYFFKKGVKLSTQFYSFWAIAVDMMCLILQLDTFAFRCSKFCAINHCKPTQSGPQLQWKLWPFRTDCHQP